MLTTKHGKTFWFNLCGMVVWIFTFAKDFSVYWAAGSSYSVRSALEDQGGGTENKLGKVTSAGTGAHTTPTGMKTLAFEGWWVDWWTINVNLTAYDWVQREGIFMMFLIVLDIFAAKLAMRLEEDEEYYRYYQEQDQQRARSPKGRREPLLSPRGRGFFV